MLGGRVVGWVYVWAGRARGEAREEWWRVERTEGGNKERNVFVVEA